MSAIELIRAEVAEVRIVHRAYGVYDECGHDHQEEGNGVVDVNDIGLCCKDGLLWTVCFKCACDDNGDTLEDAEKHPWPCHILRLAEEKLKLAEALEAACQFIQPEIQRGPDSNGWVNTIDLIERTWAEVAPAGEEIER